MKFPTRTIVWVALFAVAFAGVEAAVVVYLRALYYPDGFVFPLKLIERPHLFTELAREFATIVMLVAVGILAGKSPWQRFAHFILAFGVWDIFYYVWLKVFLDWPATLTEWDVLFLIPMPWIGPVIAPVIIAILMIVAALGILRCEASGLAYSPSLSTWILGAFATAVVLFTFLCDTGATLRGELPEPFHWGIFGAGVILYAVAIWTSLRKPRAKARQPAS